jgi:hypothetical protein
VPSEQRGYVGLAGTIAWPTDAASLPGALASIELPEARPFAAGDDDRVRTRDVRALEPAPPGIDPALATSLAEAVLFGGAHVVAGATEGSLPPLFGRLLAWLPAAARVRPREGVFAARVRVPTSAPARAPGVENLIRYLALSFAPPAGLEAHALAIWELLADTKDLVELFGELGKLAEAWDRAGDLARYLRGRWLQPDEVARCERRAPAPLFATDRDTDAGELWNRVLNYWGRELLPAELAGRLARILAWRIIVDHLVHLDQPDQPELPYRYVRRLRYEALLPKKKLEILLAALDAELPGLS